MRWDERGINARLTTIGGNDPALRDNQTFLFAHVNSTVQYLYNDSLLLTLVQTIFPLENVSQADLQLDPSPGTVRLVEDGKDAFAGTVRFTNPEKEFCMRSRAVLSLVEEDLFAGDEECNPLEPEEVGCGCADCGFAG